MSEYMVERIDALDEAVLELGRSASADTVDEIGVRSIRQILRSMRARHMERALRLQRAAADGPRGIERGCVEA
jgi:hypothetical protein